jgi:glyoxylase-like metal-dependent hydrolase (beta-lactamase superfamily II)
VLELTVSSVVKNPKVDIPVPDAVRSFSLPPVTVAVEKLAGGVYYLKGGSHHSVAVEQADHVVVVEAPLDDSRSSAVIAKVRETIPNKPIRYVVHSHHHFDHFGGLTVIAAEGAAGHGVVRYRDAAEGGVCVSAKWWVAGTESAAGFPV